VRSADARSRDRDGCEGVAQGFHVRLNKVAPGIGSLCRNLLSKHRCRSALAGEPVELGPEVPVVVSAALLSGRAEGLAGT
jgi:hypothetical protein